MRNNFLKKPKAIPRKTSIKLSIGIIVCLALMSTIYIGEVPYGGQPQVGKVAARTIYAPFDFSYDTGADLEETERLKKEAALNIKDIYDIDSDVYESAAQNIKSLFSTLKKIKAEERTNLDEKVDGLKTVDKLNLSESTLKALLQSVDSEKAESVLLNRLEGLFNQGVIPQEERENLVKQGKSIITMRNPIAKTESDIEVKSLKTADELKSQLPSIFDEPSFADKKLRGALTEIATKALAANLKSNIIETSGRRERAIASVPLQKKMIDVKRDELIIQRGERFTPFHVAKIEAMRSLSMEKRRFTLSLLGIFLIVAALVIIPSLYFAFYEPKIFSNNRHLFLMALIVIAITAIGRLVSLSKWPVYFIPVAMGPMLIALLMGVRPAIVIAIVTSLLTGLIVGEKFESTLIFLIGSIVGIYSVKDVRRRARLFEAGVFSGTANAFCVIGLGIINNLEAQFILNDAFWFLINGVAVGAIITGTLHLFESLFQITTNITLLELADPNNPLLKDLILKAPGTYHHSLIVGNLAESACEAIGANGLLARVGAYYHDIGKVEKAEYFAENQPIMESQHDKLAPTMSSLIIINHVKEGLEKAKRAKLNKALIDFIEQHHGTGLIYYFYQRALESVEDLDKLGEQGFRYPGPKPQTKETAIVHLADSVEAASRTLKNPTPANLEELVRRIINNKFIDGQLDECELTLKDLNIIASTFTKVLTGVYHTRIDYPDEKEKTNV